MGTSKSEFANYQELKDSGVYYGGWLPKYIPKTSINIKEEHYFDTNSVFATFQYDPAEILEVKEHCMATPKENGYINFFCPPFIGSINIFVLHKNGNGYYQSRIAYHDDLSQNP